MPMVCGIGHAYDMLYWACLWYAVLVFLWYAVFGMPMICCIGHAYGILYWVCLWYAVLGMPMVWCIGYAYDMRYWACLWYAVLGMLWYAVLRRSMIFAILVLYIKATFVVAPFIDTMLAT